MKIQHILQLNVEKKKDPECWLSTVLCWFLWWWLFADSVLSVIIWFNGHNWGGGRDCRIYNLVL